MKRGWAILSALPQASSRWWVAAQALVGFFSFVLLTLFCCAKALCSGSPRPLPGIIQAAGQLRPHYLEMSETWRMSLQWPRHGVPGAGRLGGSDMTV